MENTLDDIMNKQEIIHIIPFKIESGKVELSLTFEQYYTLQKALDSMRVSRLSSRKYAKKTKNCKPKNKKKPFYVLDDINIENLKL